MKSGALTGWFVVAACFAAAGVLCAAPKPLEDRLRGLVLDLLKPGMQLAVRLREQATAPPANPSDRGANADLMLQKELELTRAQLRHAEIDAARLRAELETLRESQPRPFQGEPGRPLFNPDVLSVRVLDPPRDGDVEQTLLTLSEGHAARVALAEWVLADEGVIVSHGDDARVKPDHPVLSGRRVFGRIASTGRFTSRVQHITDPGFKTHARIIRKSGEATIQGAEGLLAGAGNGRCRLELIADTEPVEPGDLVVTAASIPGIDDSLFLGTVETTDLPKGAAHWTIIVAPAVYPAEVRELEVVRVGLHPDRLIDEPDPASGGAP